MAGQQQQQGPRMQAPFPAPPPFYHHFAKQNLSELRRRRKEAGVPAEPSNGSSNNEGKRDLDILSLPTELRYLLPPPPPTDGTFTTFGIPRSIAAPTPSLADLGIEQLYPDYPSVRLNPQSHLISLARSQLTTFLTLVGNLSANPAEGWEEPTKDLEVLSYNMMDLINHYRPHQARETLIMLMEERVERMKGEVRAIREGKERVREVMEAMQGVAGTREGEGVGAEAGSQAEGAVEKEDGKRKGRQRDAWAALEGQIRALD